MYRYFMFLISMFMFLFCDIIVRAETSGVNVFQVQVPVSFEEVVSEELPEVSDELERQIVLDVKERIVKYLEAKFLKMSEDEDYVSYITSMAEPYDLEMIFNKRTVVYRRNHFVNKVLILTTVVTFKFDLVFDKQDLAVDISFIDHEVIEYDR